VRFLQAQLHSSTARRQRQRVTWPKFDKSSRPRPALALPPLGLSTADRPRLDEKAGCLHDPLRRIYD
jgi:hypothetical protein